MNTTKRYVHPSEADILQAMEKVRGGERIGCNLTLAGFEEPRGFPAVQ